MTPAWILVGIVALILVVAFGFYGYRFLSFAAVFVLMLFARIVMERKTVEKFVLWCMDRSEERTMFGLAIMGWGIVAATVATIIAAFVVPYWAITKSS